MLTIDGHDLAEIDEAFRSVAEDGSGQPTVILARTIKGRGFSEVEDHEGWHGKPFPPDMAARAIAELGGERSLLVRGPLPADAAPGPAPAMPSAADQAHGTPQTAGTAGACLRTGRQGRHPQGVRRRAGRARHRPARGGGARR